MYDVIQLRDAENLIKHGGSGSFSIFISARGDRETDCTVSHSDTAASGMPRCCQIYTPCLHQLPSLGLGSTLNLRLMNVPREHPKLI